MKTNGIPSYIKDTMNTVQTTFGAAQEVRKAIDNGGLAGGMSEGINQYCKNKGGTVAQVLAGFSNSSLGKFFLKKLLHLNFNEHGDSVEIKTDDIAKAMGQDGKLGGYLLDVIGGGQDGWLSKTCSTVCTKCSNVVSHAVESLVNKIQNETIRNGIKNILSHDEPSAKTRSKEEAKKAREEAKKAREEAFNEINQQISSIASFSELNEQISSYSEVSLTDDQKDKLYTEWAKSHTDIGDGDKRNVFETLSLKAKRNLGFNDDLTDVAKTDSRNEAIKKLFPTKTC